MLSIYRQLIYKHKKNRLTGKAKCDNSIYYLHRTGHKPSDWAYELNFEAGLQNIVDWRLLLIVKTGSPQTHKRSVL